jgi:hypothetical protein
LHRKAAAEAVAVQLPAVEARLAEVAVLLAVAAVQWVEVEVLRAAAETQVAASQFHHQHHHSRLRLEFLK